MEAAIGLRRYATIGSMRVTDEQIRDAIGALLDERQPPATICPSEAARALAPDGWRPLMPQVRAVAIGMAREGALHIRQGGRPVVLDGPLHGPIRLGRTLPQALGHRVLPAGRDVVAIQPGAADPALAQQRECFNALVEDVALWRDALAEWKARSARYQHAVEPVRRELYAAWREWVLALDRASLQPGLSRAERGQLGEMLVAAADALVLVEDDAEVTAVVRRHRDDSPALQPRQNAVDGSADETVGDDLAQDWERQAATAAALREERTARRRAATVSRPQTQAAQEASQSLRGVYRRLASALHPDREQDEHQRMRKTALMQQANQAYAEGHLLALLELQLQAEQVDATHAAAADARRLQHYIKILQDQLADLQSETRRHEAQFRAAAGVAPGAGLQPRKADRIVSTDVQRLRSEVLLLRAQARLFADTEATRRWLRDVRKG
ncbi:MAG: J domain-containing protein [Ramlibacter sp.]